MTKTSHLPIQIVVAVALAALIRVASVTTNREDVLIDDRFFMPLFFALPLLQLLSLLLIAGPSMVLSRVPAGLQRAGVILVSVVLINALLRVVDFYRWGETCAGENYGRYEGVCDAVVMQQYCNVPFIFFGAVILLAMAISSSRKKKREPQQIGG